MRTIVALAIAALGIAGGAGAATGPPQSQPEVRSLDGSGNDVRHPDWGQTFTQYLRVTDPNYADGVSQPVSGPSARYISNRIFNDEGQNLFSENGVTQWGWTWGQFLDHTFGVRDETPAENLPIPFDKHDPLEEFQNDVGSIDFARTPAAPGTGTSKHNPRQQINTVSSYIDAFSVYGGTNARLEWLRTGPVDGNMANNGATLTLTPDGYLPRADARGNAATAPPMDVMGALMGTPSRAVEAGDVRSGKHQVAPLPWYPAVELDWSPSGRQFAFTRWEWGEGASDLHLMDANGGHRRLVRLGFAANPDWSPDGQKIAFTYYSRDLGTAGIQVGVINPSGRGLMRLTTGRASSFDPAWSPDGRQIAFVREPTGNGFTSVLRADSEIYVMNADGTNVRQLTHDKIGEASPAWQPTS
jgi:hypothetical protein